MRQARDGTGMPRGAGNGARLADTRNLIGIVARLSGRVVPVYLAVTSARRRKNKRQSGGREGGRGGRRNELTYPRSETIVLLPSRRVSDVRK